MRVFAVAVLVTVATTAHAGPKGHPWVERFRDAIGAELEPGALGAIDLSRTAGKPDLVIAYALADLVARDLAPRALVIAKLPDLARGLQGHAAVTNAASAKRMQRALEAASRVARAKSPTRCRKTTRDCAPSPGENAANLVDMAIETLDDLGRDPTASVQLAVDMFESVSGSAHTMTEDAALKAARAPLIAKTRALFSELVGMVDAQGGGGGTNLYITEYETQLRDLFGDELRLTAKVRERGTNHVPIVLRLADHVVRDLTAQAFEDAGRTVDAAALRKLAPLRNAASVQLASQLVQSLAGTTKAHPEDTLTQAQAAIASALEALHDPTDDNAGFDIAANAAQALVTVLEAQLNQISERTELAAKQANAALAQELVRRLAQR